MAPVDQMALLAVSMELGSRNGGSFLPSWAEKSGNTLYSGSQRPIFYAPCCPPPTLCSWWQSPESWSEKTASPPCLPHPGGLPQLILDSHSYMAILGDRPGPRGAATDLREAVGSRERVGTRTLHLSGMCSQFCQVTPSHLFSHARHYAKGITPIISFTPHENSWQAHELTKLGYPHYTDHRSQT